MLVLGLDTATRSCTVALAENGVLLTELTLISDRAHSTRLMPLIAQCLQEAGRDKHGLDAVCVGTGPGSFTGLRIGLATAKGLCLALNKPLLGVPSLEALAAGQGAAPGRLVAPLFDAKRGEVYTGLYRTAGEWVEVVREPVLVPLTEWLGELSQYGEPVLFCGDALALHRETLLESGFAQLAPTGLSLPRAWTVAVRGGQLLAAGVAADPQAVSPLYLRASEAERIWAAKEAAAAQGGSACGSCP